MSNKHFTDTMLSTLPHLVREHILEQRKVITRETTRANNAERQVRDMESENRRIRAKIAELESRS